MMTRKLMLAVSWFLSSALLMAAATEERAPTSYRTPEQKAQLFAKLGLSYTDRNIWHPYLGNDELHSYFPAEVDDLFGHLKISRVSIGSVTQLSRDDMRWMMRHTPKLAQIFSDNTVDCIVYEEVAADSPSPRYLDNLMLRPTPKIGNDYGLFAARALKKGAFLGEYTGKILYVIAQGQEDTSAPIVRWLDYPKHVSEDEAVKATMLSSDADQSYNQMYLTKHPIFYQDPAAFAGRNKEWLAISALTHRNEIAFANNDRLHANAETRLIGIVRGIVDAVGSVKFTFNLAVALFAKEDILEGDQILFDYGYNEKSLAVIGKTFISLSPMDDRGCSFCDARLEKPLRCGACKATFYCGQECQKQHWPVHKDPCNAKREIEPAQPKAPRTSRPWSSSKRPPKRSR